MNAEEDSPEEVERIVKLLLEGLSRLDLSIDEKLNRVAQMGLSQAYVDKARKILRPEENLDEEEWEKVNEANDNTIQSFTFVSDEEMKKSAKIRRYGCSEFHVEFPICKEIPKEKLCQTFDEKNDQDCHIFQQYQHLSSLKPGNNHFIPPEDGEYIVVFGSDKVNLSSMKLLGIQLKVSDGLYPDLTTAVRKEILSLVDDKEHQNLEIYFEYARWNLLAKWAVRQPVEVQEILRDFLVGKVDQELFELLASSIGVSPALPSSNPETTLVKEQNSNETIASNKGQASKQENQEDSKLIKKKTQSSLENVQEIATQKNSLVNIPSTEPTDVPKTSPKPPTPEPLSPKDAFVNLLPDDIRSAMDIFIEHKDWTTIEILLNDKSEKIKQAFQTFMDNYRKEHPEEFPSIFEEPLTIVILGETGVGKSTFINSFVNYMKYATMYEAKDKGPEILIKTKFVHLDEELNPMGIECIPTVEIHEEDKINEILAAGQSSTQLAKAYRFQLGPEPRQSIRIIDTPGVGDCRGMEKEAENFSNTLRFLADYEKIDAFLVLMKPNKPRLTVMFKYCISELLAHLHHSASQNILFCFTNSRGTEYSPGDTLPVLQEHLNDLYDKRKIMIPIKQDTVFCFDNESFRFLCAWWKKAKFEESEIQEFNKSWEISVKETFRLMDKIKTLAPHRTEETLSINNIRSVIFTFARPLAKLGQVLESNIELIKQSSADITAQEAKAFSLEKSPPVLELLLPHAKELEFPLTVCTDEKCIEIRSYQLANGSRTAVTNYKTKCHSPKCYLKGVALELVPNEQIKSCACFGKTGGAQCINCGCPWNTHMHVRHELVEEKQRVDNTQRDQELAQCKNELQRKKVVLRDLERRKTNMEEERAKIRSCCAEFVAFLRKNSMVPYNDVFREYTVQLIKEEKAKVLQGEPDRVLNELRNSLKAYDEQVKMLEELPENHPSNKTIEQIQDMIQDIKNLPNCKDLLSAVEALEWMSIRREQTNRTTKVAIDNGWVYRQMKNSRR